MNNTLIYLIPKKDNAISLDEFRPISLCNIVYTINVTTMENRLKQILPSTVSKEQTRFWKGRYLLDGVIISQEAIHSIQHNIYPSMTINLDIKMLMIRLIEGIYVNDQRHSDSACNGSIRFFATSQGQILHSNQWYSRGFL